MNSRTFIHEQADIYAGRAGYVIGNGTSRLAHNLVELVGDNISVGCNALSDDFVPSYAVAIDGPAGKALWESDRCPALIPQVFSKPRQHDTYRWNVPIGRDPMQDDPASFNVKEIFIRGISGVIALQTALVLGCDPIILVGMEHSFQPHHSHSVYAGKGLKTYSRGAAIKDSAGVWMDGGFVPIGWLDSVLKLWWICSRYGKERSIFRVDSVGVLDFLPVVGEPRRDIIPPPTTSCEKFRYAFAPGKKPH